MPVGCCSPSSLLSASEFDKGSTPLKLAAVDALDDDAVDETVFVDVDDVRRVESSQLASIVLGENVVRGSQDEIEIDPRVAKGAERFEARHVSRLASRQPDRKTPRPEKRGTGKMGV